MDEVSPETLRCAKFRSVVLLSSRSHHVHQAPIAFVTCALSDKEAWAAIDLSKKFATRLKREANHLRHFVSFYLGLKVVSLFGVRRQSAAATALWMKVAQTSVCEPRRWHHHLLKSVPLKESKAVSPLRSPPHSKF
jgi:hypothetical protein